MQVYDSVFSNSFQTKVNKNFDNFYEKKIGDIKSQLPYISSSTNDSPMNEMNIIVNRKNMKKLQNSIYQNNEKNGEAKKQLNEISLRDQSNDRKKYNLSPSEFQSEQEMMLLEQRKQKLIDKQNEQYQGIRIQISKEKNIVKHLTENLQLDGVVNENLTTSDSFNPASNSIYAQSQMS